MNTSGPGRTMMMMVPVFLIAGAVYASGGLGGSNCSATNTCCEAAIGVDGDAMGSPCADQVRPAPGDEAPSFDGMDVNGAPVDMEALRKKGDVVLFFYRGAWCPYCDRHMSAVQDSLQMITDLGASVVAITPETAESAEGIIAKSGATFSVVHDAGYRIMCQYGTAFKADEKTVAMLSSHGIDIEKANANKEHILTVPATYIIGKDGRIKAMHFNENYKERMSVKDIIAALQ